MRDVMLQNPATATGGTLVTGGLSDGTQGLLLSDTGTFIVPDSASSSLAVATTGGMALTGLFKVAALPTSTQTIMGKVGSYELKLTPAGKVQWILTNGTSTVTVTSNTTIALNRFYMVAGVYNGDYTGAPQFGKTTLGATTTSTPGDYVAGVETSNRNLVVGLKTIQEHGHINEVVVDMVHFGDVPAVYAHAAAVVYKITDGLPTELLDQSPGQQVAGPFDMTRHWYSFPVDALVYRGSVGLGMVFGAHMANAANVMLTGINTTGGTTWSRHAAVTNTSTWNIESDSPDPFGTATATSVFDLAIYANYTPTSRTGDEGQALLYLDGVLDNSASYTSGVADTVANLQHPAGLAVTLDDWMIFDRKLTAEEVAVLQASL